MLYLGRGENGTSVIFLTGNIIWFIFKWYTQIQQLHTQKIALGQISG